MRTIVLFRDKPSQPVLPSPILDRIATRVGLAPSQLPIDMLKVLSFEHDMETVLQSYKTFGPSWMQIRMGEVRVRGQLQALVFEGEDVDSGDVWWILWNLVQDARRVGNGETLDELEPLLDIAKDYDKDNIQ